MALQAFGNYHRVLYGGPTDEQSDRFWQEICNALAPGITQGIYLKNESDRTITSVQHPTQRIKCKTAWSPDGYRGDYADLLILDEYQLMHPEVWKTVCAPMLLDNDGDALFIFTPPSLATRSISKATKDPKHAQKLFEKASKDRSGRWEAFHFTSHDNPHISEKALAEIIADMTQLSYRQEILAEMISELPGALWTQKLLDKTRVQPDEVPPLIRIVVGVDPSGSSRTECGIVACGIAANQHRYVLRDCSLLAPTSEAWASSTVKLYVELKADRIIAERNYGGDMVQATIRQVDANAAYGDVVATRGKLIRAEPIAAAFEQGRAHLVGDFPEMEGELCSYVPGEPSPNRLDAMVWAMTELRPDSDVLGVFDFFRTLTKATAKLFTPGPPQTKTLGRLPEPKLFLPPEPPPPADKPDGCENCGSSLLVRIGGPAWHCNQCGHQTAVESHRLPESSYRPRSFNNPWR